MNKLAIGVIIGAVLMPFAVWAAFETTNTPFGNNPSTGTITIPSTQQLQVGAGTLLANTPFGVFGSSQAFVQATIQNTLNSVGSSAGFTVNNSSSTNTTYFGEFGINDQTFSSSTYSGESAGDVFVSASDGNLDVQAGSSTAGIKFMTGGYLQANIRSFFEPNGKISFGIGTTTASSTMQIATSTANATSTVTFGKDGQTKGSQFQMYDGAGAKHCVIVTTGNTLVVSTGACNL